MQASYHVEGVIMQNIEEAVMKHKRFSVIGGDQRQLYIADMLRNADIPCVTFGFAESRLGLEDAIRFGEIIMLPIPSFKGYNLNAPLCPLAIPTERLIQQNFCGKTVFGGKIPQKFTSSAELQGAKVIDITERDDFALQNAVSTAEGAIMIAMRETDFTVQDSRCLVVGYGRIGKILANRLKLLNASVTATARRTNGISHITADGLQALSTSCIAEHIKNFDIIFNTVPAVIFDDRVLSSMCRDTLIIDLASLPGGVDFEAAAKYGIRAISALSLPGRTAPRSAAKVILDTVNNIISEEGL